MFLNLDVDVADPADLPGYVRTWSQKRKYAGAPYHSFEEQPAPKKGTGVTNISERVSSKNGRDQSQK